jgi:hypothetical protein
LTRGAGLALEVFDEVSRAARGASERLAVVAFLICLQTILFPFARTSEGIGASHDGVALRAVLAASTQSRVIDVITSLNHRARLIRQGTIEAINVLGTRDAPITKSAIVIWITDAALFTNGIVANS